MMAIAWIFLGAVAAGATYLSLTRPEDELVIITGIVGMLAWLLFAFYALDVGTYDQTGSLHTDAFPAMAVWGVMMAVPNLYVAITGPLEIVKKRADFGRQVS